MKRIGILFFAIIISIVALLMSGCGKNTPSAPAATGTASQYAKLNAGNTWTWVTTNSTAITGTPTVAASMAVSELYGVATASGTTVSSTITIASITTTPVISYIGLDAAGNLIKTNASGTSILFLPATFSTGNTYTLPASLIGIAGTNGNVTATIAAINTTHAVAGIPAFNDVLQINLSGTISYNAGLAIIPMNVTGAIYVSKSAGNIIDINITATGTIPVGIVPPTITYTYSQVLQPGYTAL